MIPEINTIPDVKAYPSDANFFIMETPYSPAVVFDKLLGEGYLVRNVSSYPMLDKALRVSVSFPEDNAGFIATLKQVINDCRKER